MAGEGAAAGSLPKPQLRGLHQATIKRNIAVASALAIASIFIIKFGRNEPRKQDYANFYKNYDLDKAYKRMVEAGHLDSVKSV